MSIRSIIYLILVGIFYLFIWLSVAHITKRHLVKSLPNYVSYQKVSVAGFPLKISLIFDSVYLSHKDYEGYKLFLGDVRFDIFYNLKNATIYSSNIFSLLNDSATENIEKKMDKICDLSFNYLDYKLGFLDSDKLLHINFYKNKLDFLLSNNLHYFLEISNLKITKNISQNSYNFLLNILIHLDKYKEVAFTGELDYAKNYFDFKKLSISCDKNSQISLDGSVDLDLISSELKIQMKNYKNIINLLLPENYIWLKNLSLFDPNQKTQSDDYVEFTIKIEENDLYINDVMLDSSLLIHLLK